MHDHHVPSQPAGNHGSRPANHDQHAGHDPEMFRRKFWLTLALTIPLVVTSHMVMDWFDYDLDFPGIQWLGPVLGSVVFWWGGWPFLSGGLAEVRDRRPGMMLLISMAITVAYAASAATSLDWLDLEFWWELAALVTIMLLGHWQEMKAIGQARGALAALAELLPDIAELVDGDTVRPVDIDDLRLGDVVLVRAGGRVPADGRIIAGEAELDESMITGESRPVMKASGDRVVAGTVSTDSSIRIRIDAVGEDTALAGIQRLVADAQASHGRAQVLADRFAALLFYVAAAAGVLTFVVWSALGNVDDAVVRTVTVLVIACPHALGLAIPLVISLSTAVAAKNGVLVKDRLALERMRDIDTVLFDKTGTLTRGAHVVSGVAAADGLDDGQVLRLAGAVESESEHPLARAIVAAAAEHGPVPRADRFRSLTGRGVEATVEGTVHAVGGPAFLRERNLHAPNELAEPIEQWQRRGAAVLYLVRAEEVVGAFALEDEIRPEAREAVAELQRMGVKVAMITGDARQVADAVGRDLGIDDVFAEVLPEDKDRAVAELQRRGASVAMVGDGVNDSPALARADVGLAIGAGTDVAIESAGVVLASSDPRSVAGVIRLSRSSYRKMVQNLAWAAGYNILAIPLAAGVLAWAGITLSPAVGAILMSLSTIVVAINAQLLRRLRLTSPHQTRDASPEGCPDRPGGAGDRRPPDTPQGYTEEMAGRRLLNSAGVKLGVYAAILSVALSGGVLAGAALGPSPSGTTADHREPAEPGQAEPPDRLPAGLAVSRDGHTLDLRTAVVEPDVPTEVAFVIEGPDGRPVVEYTVEHDYELHLVIVRRDLARYGHLHPTRDAEGQWTVSAPPLTPGSYRVFADFVPAGGERLTLGADLTVPGDHRPVPIPVPATMAAADVDGFRVGFDGELVAGTEAEITVAVTRHGEPITDLQPYLGALGHLVVIRSGDLAYLHVHPLEVGSDGTGVVRFAVEVPTAGTYGLYFDFLHGDVVRTATTVASAARNGPTPQTDAPADHAGAHGG